nr:hypothetical protein [Rhizoctonia solani fusarivirus 5]
MSSHETPVVEGLSLVTFIKNMDYFTDSEIEYVRDFETSATIIEGKQKMHKLITRMFSDQTPVYKQNMFYWDAEISVVMTQASQDDPLAVGLAAMIERGSVTNTHTGQQVWMYSSACGTGKTTGMPLVLAKHFGYEKVLLLVPRIMSARGAYSFYSSRGVPSYCRAGGETLTTGNIPKSKVAIVTMGSLPGVLKSGILKDLSKYLFIYDECHDSSPETAIAWSMITGNCKNTVVCMSATPQHFKFPSLKTMKTTNWFIAEPYDEAMMKQVGLHNSQKKRAQRILDLNLIIKDLPMAGHTIAIVGASIRACQSFMTNFPYNFPVEVTVSAAGMTYREVGKPIKHTVQKPDTKLLAEWVKDDILQGRGVAFLCTPVVEVGVTLPHVDFVIDAGSRYRISVKKDQVQLDVYNQSQINEVGITPASYAEATQVMGRISRTHPGTSLLFNAENIGPSPMTWSEKVLVNGRLIDQGFPRAYDIEEPAPGKGFKAAAQNFISSKKGMYDEMSLRDIKTAQAAIEVADCLTLLGKVPKSEFQLPVDEVLRHLHEGRSRVPFSGKSITQDSMQLQTSIFLGLDYRPKISKKEKVTFSAPEVTKRAHFEDPGRSYAEHQEREQNSFRGFGVSTPWADDEDDFDPTSDEAELRRVFAHRKPQEDEPESSTYGTPVGTPEEKGQETYFEVPPPPTFETIQQLEEISRALSIKSEKSIVLSDIGNREIEMSQTDFQEQIHDDVSLFKRIMNLIDSALATILGAVHKLFSKIMKLTEVGA